MSRARTRLGNDFAWQGVLALTMRPFLTGHETRRTFLLAAAGGLLVGACSNASRAALQPVAPTPARAADQSTKAVATLTAIEQKTGGRLGVCALDVETGNSLGYRSLDRFAMCSTFKWALAAQLLARVDAGQLALSERIAYGPQDVLEYAPVAKAHVSEGGLTLEALARAAVTVSDNTAANLLLAKLGGPPAFTEFAGPLSDGVVRLDRSEPFLNSNQPNDPRDTTTARAMVQLMNRVLLGSVLSAPSKERLLGWMQACETGRRRLRAGLPEGFRAGDKTGTGERGACNDVAIALPPGRAPILIACYMSDSSAALDVLERAHADVARVVIQALG